MLTYIRTTCAGTRICVDMGKYGNGNITAMVPIQQGRRYKNKGGYKSVQGYRDTMGYKMIQGYRDTMGYKIVHGYRDIKAVQRGTRYRDTKGIQHCTRVQG